ncbi:type IV conjugative transfer system protein TraL [Burkholderia glumae]
MRAGEHQGVTNWPAGAGKHPGMSTHVAYWVIGRPTLKVLPASAIRELNG